MVKKTDISAFKNTAPKDEMILADQVPSKRGRKAKPADEKASETIAIRVTKAEKARIKEKAGIAALGTYIRHRLAEDTDVFE